MASAQFHALNLLTVMTELLPDWLPERLFNILYQRWNSPERAERCAPLPPSQAQGPGPFSVTAPRWMPCISAKMLLGCGSRSAEVGAGLGSLHGRCHLNTIPVAYLLLIDRGCTSNQLVLQV